MTAWKNSVERERDAAAIAWAEDRERVRGRVLANQALAALGPRPDFMAPGMKVYAQTDGGMASVQALSPSQSAPLAFRIFHIEVFGFEPVTVVFKPKTT